MRIYRKSQGGELLRVAELKLSDGKIYVVANPACYPFVLFRRIAKLAFGRVEEKLVSLSPST